MKKIVFSVAMFLLLVVLIEGLSGLGLIYLNKKKDLFYRPLLDKKLTADQIASIQKLLDQKEKYLTYSPILGWTIKSNGKTKLYQSNSAGIRSNTEYSVMPPKNKIRIATYGDSYVHCDEVKNHETWQEHLNALDKKIETINFGVSGYGLDQAYLKYKDQGKKYKPDIVFIGFMTENPKRSVNVFRPFYDPDTKLPLSKPRYKIVDNNLALIDNPIPQLRGYQALLENPTTELRRLSEHDFYFSFKYGSHPLDFFLSVRLFKILKLAYLKPKETIMNDMFYNTKSDVFKVTITLLEEFYTRVKNDGAIPIVLVIPNSGDFWRINEHNAKNYIPFLEVMDEKNIPYIDLTDYFLNDSRNADLSILFAPGYHLSNLGNQRLAEYIYDYLVKNNLLSN